MRKGIKMNFETIMSFVGVVVAPLVAFIFREVSGTKKELADYKEQVAQMYAPREEIKRIEDYQEQVAYEKDGEEVLSLPKSDVIKYILDNDAWVVVRPSGTEPKLKVYYSCKASSMEEAENLIKKMDDDILRIIEQVSND